MQIIVNLNDPSDVQMARSLFDSITGDAPVVTGGGIAAIIPPPGAAIGDRDAEGCPWDERIHASTKTRTAKNLWTRRKGIEDTVYASVRAQLLAAPNGESVPTPPPMTPPAPTAPTPPPQPPAAAPTPPPEPTFPPNGWVAHPSAPGYFYCGQEVLTEAQLREKMKPVTAVEVTWPAICQVMNEKLSSGRLDMEKLTAVGTKYGVTPFAMLATKKDMWPQVLADLQAA